MKPNPFAHAPSRLQNLGLVLEAADLQVLEQASWLASPPAPSKRFELPIKLIELAADQIQTLLKLVTRLANSLSEAKKVSVAATHSVG